MMRLLLICALLAASHAFQVAPFVRTRDLLYHAVKPTVSYHQASAFPTTRPLAMAESGSDADDSSNTKMERKIKGRKKRVLYGYRAVMVAYAFLFLRTLTKYGIARPFSSDVSLATLVASSLAYIESGAISRLSSDTYKRLNLALAKYGFIGLVLLTLVPETNNPVYFVWIATSFVAMVNSIKGYGYGLKGWELGKASALSDFKGVYKCFWTLPKNPMASVYWTATLVLGGLTLVRLKQMGQLVMNGGSPVQIAALLSRQAKLALFSIVTLTLKDAADRDRLDGTTFIELNLVSAAAFLTTSLACLRQAGTVTPLAAGAAAFSVFSAITAITSAIQKNKKE